MTTTFEIPLSPQPQTIRVALGAETYQITVQWIDQVSPGWVLSIADDAGAPILSSVPLVTGADLLAPYDYLGISGSLVVQTDHDAFAAPTFENLGVTAHLYYVP